MAVTTLEIFHGDENSGRVLRGYDTV